MVRRHDNLHRDRAEQLKLRGNLANVYDVVRDLGLHYELKEISGCTFITIGRTQHKYSHLDKDLVWTVSTDRVCDNQYAEQKNVILGDVTATASETILGLQRTAQEQEEEIRMLNIQLTNLSSNLQAVNSLASEKAGTNLGLHNLTQEQDEEIRRLNTKLVNLSSKLQTANEKEKALLNSQENAHEKEEEMRKINQQLSQLSRLLEVTNETKTKAEHSAQESIKEIEELEGRIDRSENLRKAEDDFAKQNLQRQKEEITKLSLALSNLESKNAKESTAEVKELQVKLETAKLELHNSSKALSLATSNLDDAEKKTVGLEEVNEKLLSTQKDRMAEIHEMWREMDMLREQLGEAENKSHYPNDTLEKLSRAIDEIEDKDDKIKVILDQNIGLNKKVTKLSKEIDELKEDHKLQLASLHNHLLKEVLAEAPDVIVAEEMGKMLPQTLATECTNERENGSNDDTTDPLVVPHQNKDQHVDINTNQEIENEGEKNDQELSDEHQEKFDTTVEENMVTTITTAIVETLLDDKIFQSKPSSHHYEQTIQKYIAGEDFLKKIVDTIDEVTSQVLNKDTLPDMSELYNDDARDIREKILTNLPGLIQMLMDGNVFQEPYLKDEVYLTFHEHFSAKIRELMAEILESWYGDPDSEENDESCEAEDEIEMNDQELSDKHKVVHDYYSTISDNIQIITSVVADPFISTFVKLRKVYWEKPPKPQTYAQNIQEIITSEDFVKKIADLIEDITAHVDNKDTISDTYNFFYEIAQDIREEIFTNLPALIQMLTDDNIFQTLYLVRSDEVNQISREHFTMKTGEILRNLMESITNTLWHGWSNSDGESGDEQNSFTSNFPSQPPTLTSTPNKEQNADNTGNESVHREIATDSGLGTSGIFSEAGAQAKKSVSKNSGTKPHIFSKTEDAALKPESEVITTAPESEAAVDTLPPIFPRGFLNAPKLKGWIPSRPKWVAEDDPNYFHCHQDQPKLCYRCSLTWGYYQENGFTFDGRNWV